MPHNVGLISTIAAGFGLAMVFGDVAARLKVPPLVGYLFAAILVGPATPASHELARGMVGHVLARMGGSDAPAR